MTPGTDVALSLHIRSSDASIEGDSPRGAINVSGYSARAFGQLRPIAADVMPKLQRQLGQLQGNIDQLDASALEDIDDELKVIGAQLAETLPLSLRQEIANMPQAIFIRHDPVLNFPFELVLVDDGTDEFFLGDRIAVCRWYLNVDAAPPQYGKSVERAAVLVGETPSAQSDLKLLSEKCSAEEFDAPTAVYKNVFKTSNYTLLHFIGHCDSSIERNVALVLKRGKIEMQRIARLKNEKEFGRVQPIVMLNGCGTANPYAGFLGPESFSYRFINASASLFIGTLWPVHEDVAHEFSCAFYEEMAEGSALGPALLRAKSKVAAATADLAGTALTDRQRILRRISARSYSAFGHPNFRFQFVAAT
jgi:hypothetical protein